MRGAGLRRPKESFAPDGKPPPITAPADPWQFTGGRESDASFCSSRPSSSSVGINRSSAAASIPISDRGYQISALRSINNYLSSHSSPISLKPPLPSAKDITQALRFLLAALDFTPSNKLDEDLFSVLKLLNCPIKLNKSALRAPGTPHSWPSNLSVMHWLVQIAMCSHHLAAANSTIEANSVLIYSLKSYLHYIRGDDESVDLVDREFMDDLQQQRDSMEVKSKALEGHARDLEATLERLKTEPSAKEVLEKEKKMLEEDVNKFHAMIEQLNGHIVTVEKVLNDKDKELEVKIEEKKRMCDENEELKKKVDQQVFNARDAERMKRELQAVERDIVESELARNAWEDKSWDIDAATRQKFKELEALLNQCNQSIKRLKFGNNIQYELNPKGSTAAEVLGLDYKSTLQPKLASLAEEIKTSSMAMLEEQISLERTQFEYAAKIEAKKIHIAALQSRIDKDEVQLNQLKQEAQDYISQCASEARKLVEDVEGESHKLDILEKEAAEFLQTSKVKLQESIVETEEEVQRCAREFFEVVDSVSKYKEYTAAKITEMKNELVRTVGDLSDLHKAPFPTNVGAYVDTIN